MTAIAEQQPDVTDSTGKVLCRIDGSYVHSIEFYLKTKPELCMTFEDYKSQHPGPYMSEMFERKMAEKLKQTTTDNVTPINAAAQRARSHTLQDMHTVFGLRLTLSTGATDAAGNLVPIRIKVLDRDSRYEHLIPEIDLDYVFDADTLKFAIYALEGDKSMLCWGYHGSGKTTLIEQLCARTNRPMIRVNHQDDVESADVLGETKIKDGSTFFEPGFLPEAMRYGLVYLADEFDAMLPGIAMAYQAPLEGKDLVVKGASEEWKMVSRHPDFRFFATGNTNGSGDETGLYSGTNLQNAASYSRFPVVIKCEYISVTNETKIIQGKTGLDAGDAKMLAKTAKKIRDCYIGKSTGNTRINNTVSTREMIEIARMGYAFSDWTTAFQLGFIARLSSADEAIAKEIIQRECGEFKAPAAPASATPASPEDLAGALSGLGTTMPSQGTGHSA